MEGFNEATLLDEFRCNVVEFGDTYGGSLTDILLIYFPAIMWKGGKDYGLVKLVN